MFGRKRSFGGVPVCKHCVKRSPETTAREPWRVATQLAVLGIFHFRSPESLVIARRAPSEIAQSRKSRTKFHLMVAVSRNSATPIQRVLVCLCREARAGVTSNTFFTVTWSVPNSHGRRTELLAQDLPCFAGIQLAIDITLRTPLTSAGEAHPGAPDTG